MKPFSLSQHIIILTTFLLLFALGYTLEVNQLGQAQSELFNARKLQTELSLSFQEALEQLSLVKSGDDAKRLEGELNLEQVKSFSLLAPKSNQLSLNQPPYEL